MLDVLTKRHHGWRKEAKCYFLEICLAVKFKRIWTKKLFFTEKLIYSQKYLNVVKMSFKSIILLKSGSLVKSNKIWKYWHSAFFTISLCMQILKSAQSCDELLKCQSWRLGLLFPFSYLKDNMKKLVETVNCFFFLNIILITNLRLLILCKLCNKMHTHY